MKEITRKEAKKLNLKRYYIGTCKHGHDTERYTSSGTCMTCSSLRNHNCKSYYVRKNPKPYLDWVNLPLSIEQAHQLFSYEEGKLYWKVKVNRNVNISDRVGSVKGNYRRVIIKGVSFYEHKLIAMFF